MARSVRTHLGLGVAALAAFAAAACGEKKDDPALTKADPVGEAPLPVPPENGPKLGALADVTPILARPQTGGSQIGYLHAGARAVRTEEPVSFSGCPGGWYPIRPRGVVCAGAIATTDLQHPTLTAMALMPKRDEALPYTYARTTKSTPVFKRHPAQDNAVVEVRKVASQTGFAIVGSWSALAQDGALLRLGMLTNGLFVKAEDLRAAEPSSFEGAALDEKTALPVGFVVKRGIRFWKPLGRDDQWEKGKEIEYHEKLTLSGRYRTQGGNRYWALDDGSWVRDRDVTVVQKRHTFPDFAQGEQKWIDISLVMGYAVLYEGQRPVLATLVSVGRDRLGDPKLTASTAQGDFEVVGKHVTAAKLDPNNLADHHEVHDLPWVMELSSGQLIHGAYWHDRFGIEYGPGNIQFSPKDAQKVWSWATPEVPPDWHGVNARPEGTPKTLVRVRK